MGDSHGMENRSGSSNTPRVLTNKAKISELILPSSEKKEPSWEKFFANLAELNKHRWNNSQMEGRLEAKKSRFSSIHDR